MNDRAHPEPLCVADFLRLRREQIITTWELAVQSVSKARALERPRLRNHLPEILSQIADVVDHGANDGGTAPELTATKAHSHAIERLDAGYDMGDVLREYAILRATVLDLWEEEPRTRARPRELRLLNAALDQAVSAAIEGFTRARRRTYSALDRLLVEGPGTDLTAFLGRLVTIVRDTAEAVDTVAVLLLEGDRLRVRAAAGLEGEVKEGFSLAVGEGFAGTVAATGKPLLLEGGSKNPIVASEHLRRANLRTLYGVPLFQEGRVIGVTHIGSRTATDFSDEDKLVFRTMAARATAILLQHQLLEREQEARREAERAGGLLRLAVEARDRFMAVLSHDLRNPLGSIALGAVTLVNALAHDARLRRRAEAIQTAAHRAGRMIENLLEEVALEQGTARLAFAPLDPTELLDEVHDTYQEPAKDRGVELFVVAPGGIPAVLGDEGYLHRALGNLLGNAIKYTPPGGKVVVTAARAGDRVRFAVTDTGPGVPVELRAHLFEPGFRGAAPPRGEKGLGLGLAIVKGIVVAHGGEVGIEDAPGGGAAFWFTLRTAAGTRTT